jgi:hypothetical protein
MNLRHWSLSVCLLSVLSTQLLADPPGLEVPKEVTGEPASFIKVIARTQGKNVRWFALDSGLNLFPVEQLKDSRCAVVTAGVAGRYRLVAITAAGDELSEPATCVVVVTTPVPPGPVPPGPVPPGPVPPGPTPPPNPSDPLAQTVQSAFQQETDPGKVQQIALLASLWKQAGSSLVQDPSVKTRGDLYAIIRKAGSTLLAESALPRVRRVIADELNKQLGTGASIPLDDALRSKCSQEFLRVAKILEGIK